MQDGASGEMEKIAQIREKMGYTDKRKSPEINKKLRTIHAWFSRIQVERTYDVDHVGMGYSERSPRFIPAETICRYWRLLRLDVVMLEEDFFELMREVDTLWLDVLHERRAEAEAAKPKKAGKSSSMPRSPSRRR